MHRVSQPWIPVTGMQEGSCRSIDKSHSVEPKPYEPVTDDEGCFFPPTALLHLRIQVSGSINHRKLMTLSASDGAHMRYWKANRSALRSIGEELEIAGHDFARRAGDAEERERV